MSSKRDGERYVSIMVRREVRDAVKAAAKKHGTSIFARTEAFILAGLGSEAPVETPEADPPVFVTEELSRRGMKAIRPVLDGLSFNVPVNLHERIAAAAQARGKRIGSLAAEFLFLGLGLMPAPEPLPPPARLDPKGRATCERCENPAAFCPDCLREAEDVAVVQNRLANEGREEGLRLVQGGRAS